MPTGAWRLRLSRGRRLPWPACSVDTATTTSHQHRAGRRLAALLHQLRRFHFNDRQVRRRRLTIGSIDPYSVFRISMNCLWRRHSSAASASSVHDRPGHNLKGKIWKPWSDRSAPRRSLFAKAALIDQEKLAGLQDSCSPRRSRRALRGAFWTDVRLSSASGATARGLPADPLAALRDGGYMEKDHRRAQKRRTRLLRARTLDRAFVAFAEADGKPDPAPRRDAGSLSFSERPQGRKLPGSPALRTQRSGPWIMVRPDCVPLPVLKRLMEVDMAPRKSKPAST